MSVHSRRAAMPPHTLIGFFEGARDRGYDYLVEYTGHTDTEAVLKDVNGFPGEVDRSKPFHAFMPISKDDIGQTPMRIYAQERTIEIHRVYDLRQEWAKAECSASFKKRADFVSGLHQAQTRASFDEYARRPFLVRLFTIPEHLKLKK